MRYTPLFFWLFTTMLLSLKTKLFLYSVRQFVLYAYMCGYRAQCRSIEYVQPCAPSFFSFLRVVLSFRFFFEGKGEGGFGDE